MKARITHKKAPWPEGAEVGAVVVFEAGVVPTWAAGKCVPAEEGEEPTLVVPAPTAQVEAAPQSESDRVREEADLHIKTLRSQFEEYAEDMQAKLASATAENEALQEANATAAAKVTELQATVDALRAELDKAKAEQTGKAKK